jgi:diketogulonate reductase-like aldo/keto reductase
MPPRTVNLASGSEMPMLGLGTWQLSDDDARTGVEHALQIGYRLIDTSATTEAQKKGLWIVRGLLYMRA